MKKFAKLLLAVCVLFSAFALGGCGEAKEPADNNRPLNIGFISNGGPIAKDTYNSQIWKAIDTLNNQATIFNIENLEQDSFEANLNSAIAQNPDLLWCSDSSLADIIIKAAKSNPDILFAVSDKNFDQPMDNVFGLECKGYEGAFLAGYAAAKTSKTGKIGFIGGAEVDVIKNFELAYRFGAIEANDRITVITDYVGSFDNPEKGYEFAKAQYIEGTDVIFAAAGASGLGTFDAAKEKDKWIIGVDVDQTELAPKNVLTSVIKNTSEAVKQLTQKYIDGEALGGKNFQYGIAEGIIDLAPNNGNLSADLEQELLDLKNKIADGSFSFNVTPKKFEVVYANGNKKIAEK